MAGGRSPVATPAVGCAGAPRDVRRAGVARTGQEHGHRRGDHAGGVHQRPRAARTGHRAALRTGVRHLADAPGVARPSGVRCGRRGRAGVGRGGGLVPHRSAGRDVRRLSVPAGLAGHRGLDRIRSGPAALGPKTRSGAGQRHRRCAARRNVARRFLPAGGRGTGPARAVVRRRRRAHPRGTGRPRAADRRGAGHPVRRPGRREPAQGARPDRRGARCARRGRRIRAGRHRPTGRATGTHPSPRRGAGGGDRRVRACRQGAPAGHPGARRPRPARLRDFHVGLDRRAEGRGDHASRGHEHDRQCHRTVRDRAG